MQQQQRPMQRKDLPTTQNAQQPRPMAQQPQRPNQPKPNNPVQQKQQVEQTKRPNQPSQPSQPSKLMVRPLPPKNNDSSKS